MLPTLRDGEVVIIDKSDELKKGDIVLFTPAPTWADAAHRDYNVVYIKRIVATSGDTVRVDKNGVYVNDELKVPEHNENMKETVVTLEEGEIFVMGDNVGHSFDSYAAIENGLNPLIDSSSVISSGEIESFFQLFPGGSDNE